MSQKAATAASVPVAASPDKLRNVVLVGRSGAGTSALFDHLIAATTGDYRPRPPGIERSTQLSIASINIGDGPDAVVVNLIDTPGYPDFVGELRAGLRAADAALFVISAADGLDAATTMLWQECAAVGMPRAIALTRLDAARSAVRETMAACRETFGSGVAALYLPVTNSEGTVNANIGLLTENVYDYSSGERVVREAVDGERDELESGRAELLEAIITESEDDTLLERYLGGEQIELEVLIADLLTAVSHASFFPLVPVSTDTNVGTGELLHLFSEGFPPPTLHPLPAAYSPSGVLQPALSCDPGGPLVAEVVRTASDPYVGRLSVVRVFSGTLQPDASVHISGHWGAFTGHDMAGHPDHDDDERIGPMSSPLGDTLRPRGPAIAGDICVVAKLSLAETADTLSSKDSPMLLEPWQLPDALLPVAIVARSKSDEDKLGTALARLVAEDPTLRLEHNPETHQEVLWTMGQAHVEMLITRLAERFGVNVDTEPVKVALRETFTASANGHGRHVKQSGGHGQYAVCDITVEPLPRGSGFEFVDKVVGGAVPRQFIPSVEKGVRAQLEKGVLAGFPVVDVRVTLFDGKAHSVDSSDMAFQTAGALALKDAASPKTVTLLEPVDRIAVTIGDEFVGAVLGDLQSRRVRVNGTEPAAEDGRTVIHAEIPASEILRYAIDLRSISRGTGIFTREPHTYEPMPANLAKAYLDGAGPDHG
jgi:elongation factor G